MEAVRLERRRIVWIAGSGEEERLLSRPEDEEIRDAVTQVLRAGGRCREKRCDAAEDDQPADIAKP